METLPYFLVIGTILGFSVLMFGLKAYGNIDSASSIEKVNSFVEQTNNKISVLLSMSPGSFDYVYLNAPYKMTLYSNGTLLANNKTYYINGNLTCIKGNTKYCSNKVEIYPGKYKILLYHGVDKNAKYCICFT